VQLKKVYEKVVRGEECAEDLTSCQETAKKLRNIVSGLRKDITEDANELEALKAEKGKLQAEKEKLISEKVALEAKRPARILGGIETGTTPQFDKPVFKANIDFQMRSGDVLGTGYDHNGYIYIRYSKTIFTF